MSKVVGILNFEPSYVHVRGLEDYRPISATSILGRYRIIDFMLSNFTNSDIESIKVFIKNRNLPHITLPCFYQWTRLETSTGSPDAIDLFAATPTITDFIPSL